MTVKISSLGAILGLMCILISPCYATSHAYVLSDKGEVWLVSDTLSSHTDYSYYLNQYIKRKLIMCKVAIQRGRLIFNTGRFSDLTQLESEEITIPFGDFDTTKMSIEPLLLKYRMVDPVSDDPTDWQSAGWIQVSHGVYSVEMVDTRLINEVTQRTIAHPVLRLIPGVPFGYGKLVKMTHNKAYLDPKLSKQISEEPRAELLKILQQEAIDDPQEIGGPFTVLVLHKDGTVSDYSSTPVCTIPADARATP